MQEQCRLTLSIFGPGKPANGALVAEVLRAAENLYHGQTLDIGFADTF